MRDRVGLRFARRWLVELTYMVRGGYVVKGSRQSKILEIIDKHQVETQEELADYLRKAGFQVTQATVSRDIKELRLIKVLTPEGRYRYATVEKAETDMQERFIQMFSNCVLSVASAGNLIVLKTITGSAPPAAEAIDSMKFPEIIGTIAGDNTVFVAIHDAKTAADVVKRFQNLLK